MIIFSYNFLLIILYPVFFLIGFFRLCFSKENFISFRQKFFATHNYNNFKDLETIIHFASIGELNSTKFLLDRLDSNKILLTCSTVSSYTLSKKKYPSIKIIFLPIDYYWNVKKFLSKTNINRIFWIDSEIWPNWLNYSKKAKIKNILINGRLSNKSFNNWKKFKYFSIYLGKKYELILAKSLEDKKKLNEVFQREVFYLGNLKFYLNVEISKDKKNKLCFASIHRSEFELVIKIINKLNLNLFDSITIIPRHIQFVNELKTLIGEDFKNFVKIHDKFGENLTLFDDSKIVFMGGSLIQHGGQNPLEALARGCYILSGKFNENFNEQYLDLEKLGLASIFDNDFNKIASKINDLIKLNFDNSVLINNYFKDNTRFFNKMIEMIEKC